jgi:hypothetical protein
MAAVEIQPRIAAVSPAAAGIAPEHPNRSNPVWPNL